MTFFHGVDYRTHFSSKQFLQEYHSACEGDWTWVRHFRLRQRHNLFQRYSCKWDKDRAKYLEFGGAAVVVDLISAEPHVAEIVHAGYTQDERKELELWINKQEDAHDWTFAFQQVVGELERKGDEAWKDREAALRSKIKIISCDIKQEHPIGPTEEPAPFTVISTSFCLEAACETFTEYKMAIKKLANLLKLGGYLIITGVEDETFYTIGQHKWSALPVTMEQVKEALVEAGFVVLMAEREPTSVESIQNPTISDGKALLFLAAYKVKDYN